MFITRYFEAFVAAYITGLAVAACRPEVNSTIYAALAVAVAAFLFLPVLFRRRISGLAVPVIVVLLFVGGCWRYRAADVVPPDDIGHRAGVTRQLLLRTESIPDVTAGADGYAIAVKASVVNGQGMSGNGRLLFKVKDAAAIPGYGTVLQARVQISLPPEYKNPGQPGYRDYLRQDGMTAILRTDAVTVMQPCGWPGKTGAIRTNAELLADRVLPPELAAIYNGVLFGGSSGIKKATQNEFRQTGIFHILSVSGTHISVIAAAVFWLLGILRLPRRYAALSAIAVTWLYVFLAGFVAAAVRAALMASLALFALAIRDENSARRSVWLAAFIILLVNPLNLLNVGFQLSITATLGIVYACGPVVAVLKKFLPYRAAQAAGFTLAAQAGILPVAVYYFNNITPFSLLANTMVVPVIDVAMICGMCAVVIPFMFLKVLALTFGGYLLQGAVDINASLARIPGARLYFPTLALWQIVFYYILLIYFVFGKDIKISGVLLARKLVLPAGLTLWLAAVILTAVWPVEPQIHFIDVGEGNAALIITPHHHAVMIDCGGNYKRDAEAFDVGERVVVPYLLHYGVRALDAVFLTHEHVDHAGGFDAVQRAFPVAALIRSPTEGEYIVDGVRFTARRTVSGEGAGGNGDMLLVRVEYGGKSALFTGDLTTRGEHELLEQQGDLRADILQVGHHGSKTSTSAGFLQAVQPEYAVVSVGAANRYGHPDGVVLRRIAACNTVLFRTDVNGAVEFELGGALEAHPYFQVNSNLKQGD